MKLLPIGIRRAFRHKDYVQFIIGQTVFVMGFWLRTTALSWLIYSLTGSSIYLGSVATISLLPALILGPISGILTDKIPKKNIIFCTQLVNLITTTIVFALIFSNYIEIWHIMIASFVFGASQGIGVPARNAFVLDMVGKKDIASAVPINVAIFNLGTLVGPAVAGVLIPIIAESGIFAINIFAESFALYSITKIQSKGLPDAPVEGQKNTLLDGFKYAYDKKIIFYALLFLCIAAIVNSPVQILLPIFATEILGGDSTLFGILSAMVGLGGFMGALTLTTKIKKQDIIKWLITGNIVLTFALLAFAFSSIASLSIIVLFMVGYGAILQHTSINTLVQFNAPHQYVGRIMAVHSMCLRGMSMFGSFLAGLSGEYLGVRYTMLLAFTTLIICSIYILPKLYKETKKADL